MSRPSLYHVMLGAKFFALSLHLKMTGLFSNIVMLSNLTLNLGLTPEEEQKGEKNDKLSGQPWGTDKRTLKTGTTLSRVTCSD